MNYEWLKLLETIEVIGDESNQELMGEAEFAIVENELQQNLPSAYKEFCQLLGTGLLAQSVRVFSPTKSFIAESRGQLDYAIQRLEKYMTDYQPRNLERDQWCIDLFRSAFIFGDSATGEFLLLWDLRTYREEDDSYDIYWASCGMPECDDPILIGRDFFDFIQNFCYGTKAFELVPDYMEESSLETIPRTFEQFRLPTFTDEQLQTLADEVHRTHQVMFYDE